MWRSALIRLFFGFLFVIILAVVVTKSFSLDDISRAVSLFPLEIFIILLPLALLLNALKAVRFHILARHVEIPLSLSRAFRLFFASQAATPLPAGEAIRIAFLKYETKARYVKAASPVVGQAVYEIVSAAVIVAVASVLYQHLLLPSFFLLTILATVLFLGLHAGIFDFSLDIFSRIGMIRRRADDLKEAHDHLRTNFTLREEEQFDRHTVAAILVAFASHVIGGLIVYYTASVAGIDLTFFQSMFVYASGAIIQGVLTIIPGGLGVTEGGMAGVMHLLGADVTTAIATVVIIRTATLLFPVTLGLLVFLRYYAKPTFFKQVEVVEA